MKKRLLSALLALALVFVLLPTAALADTTPVTDANVKINGSAVTVGNDISLGDGNGTYSYDKSTRTLTLNNATITATGSNIGIDFCDTTNYVTYSVILTGENTVTSNDIAIETTSNTNLTFTGGGNLKAITKGNQHQAIRVYGTLTIDNSTLIAESSAYTATTVIWTLAMTGNNAKLEISNKSAANIVAGTAGPASKNIDWSNYQFTTGSYSGDALTESDPEVCSWGTLNEYLGFPTKKYSQYICIAKRTIPALTKTSDVFIAGEQAIVGQKTSLGEGKGYYSYNKDTKTLTLEDATISSGINAIQFMAKGAYTIKLEGENKISNVSNGISLSDDQYITSLNVTITGTGSLDISARGLAINMKKGDLKFENTGEIKLTTSNPSKDRNVLSVSGNITITDMDKYSVTGITQTGNPNVTGETVTLSAASHLKGYQNPDGTAICLKTITITPTPAKDSTIRYDGTTLKQGEIITDGNGGTATVATKGNTITLNNFKGTKALSFEATLADSTLVLEGTNTLSSIVTTQKGLTISGSGSLTVGSIKVTNDTRYTGNLTITDGAKVTAGTTTSDAKAIDITGNLTVNSGATLTATNTSETNPTIDVSGNVTISGDPGTNAYTVSAHNSYNVQKDRDGHLSASGVPSAIKIGRTLNISAGARVMAQTDSYGAGVMLGQNSTITVEDAFLSAKNSSCDFAAISFSGQTGKIDVSGEKGEVVAENTHAKTNLVYRAINAFVYNRNTDFYLKMQSEGVINEAVNKIIAPGGHNASGGKKVTITRSDEVTHTESPVVIAGTTLLNDTYYTITDGSTVAEGTENNYNAFYNSKTKTLKLNNAKISTTTENAAIEIGEDSTITTITVTGTNELKGNHNHCIESYDNFTINGTGTLNMTNTNSSSSATSVIHCGPGKSLTIAAEVIIKNEAKPGNLIFTVKKDAYSFAEGYNVYASTDVSGSPLETYDAAKSSTYKYLRVTKENLAPTTPTPQTPFTIDGIPAQFVDGGMIATAGVTATSSNNINLPIDRVKWYTFTPVFGSDGRMDSVSDKTEATGNFEAGKYYVVEIKFVQDLSPFESWDMKVSGWSDNDVYRQSVTARNDIEIYFLTPASAATHEHNWAENYDPVYHWKMCTYDGCTAIKDKAPHEWTGWWVDDYRPEVHAQRCNCGYLGSTHSTLKYVAINGEQHQKQCPVDGCGYKIEYKTSHVYEEGSNICTECGYDKSAPCDHTGDLVYTNNGDGTHKVTCKACGATLFEKQNHKFDPATGACVCGATQSGGDPTPDNPGTIVIIRPAEEEKPAQQPNPSTGANDLVGLAVAAAVAAALGSAALLRKHD